MRGFLLLISLFFVVASTHAQELDRSTHLRVATWNLLNLFDEIDEVDRPDEGTDPKSFEEMKALATFINELDVDVLGVQEVENRRILKRLNRHLDRPFAHVELIEGNDTRGIDVGVLSRVPIVRAASHRLKGLAGGQSYSRDFPLFRLQVTKNQQVEVGVVHLKSKRGKTATSDAWRRAEAAGAAEVLSSLRQHEKALPVLVMGDFNDYRDAKTLEPLFSLLKDHTATLVPKEERWSFNHRGKKEQIDFILTSEEWKAKRARILHHQTNPSDHAPVVMDFDFGAPIVRVDGPAGKPWVTPKRPVIDARNLKAISERLLKETAIEGRVTKVFRPQSGAAILNFHENYREAITVYVPKDAVARFGKIEDLLGKKVRVGGPICRRRKIYQIRMTRPAQLTIMDAKR